MNKPVYLPQAIMDDFSFTDKRVWCVSWFGYFDRDENSPSEKKLKVVLVPLARGVNPKEDNLNRVAAYEKDTKEILPINIGFIPLLKLGSFWQEGKIGNFGKYSELVLELSIDDQNTYVTDKANETNLLQDSNYPYIKYFENTRLFVIEFFQKIGKLVIEKVIIPCVEVLRFYYATSSQLTRMLISGQISEEKNKPYNKEKCSLNNGVGHVHLHKIIPDTDAPHIARLAFSKYAENQAANIYHSGLRNKQNTGKFFIDAKPPFQGKTLLKVIGKFVKSSLETSDNTWNFLVFQIKSCSHPFPFKELTFSRDNDGRSIKDNEDKPETWEASPKVNSKTVNNNTEVKILNKGQPSANMVLTELIVAENDFPDLIGKKISKTEKEKNDYKAAQTQFISSENDGDFSIATVTYGKTELKPIVAIRDIPKPQKESLPKRQRALIADFGNFTSIISELSRFERVKHHFIQLEFEGESPSNQECSFFPTDINNWAYVDLENGYIRQFMVVEITYHELFFYFFEIEADPNKPHDRYSMLTIHSLGFEQISEKDLKKVVKRCVENYGRWLKDTDIEELKRKKFKHTSKDVQQCAIKFFNYIKQQVGNLADIIENSFTVELEDKNDISYRTKG